MKKKSTVAVVRVESDNITAGFARLMDLIGGMDVLVVPFHEVMIKPNWATDRDYTTGAVTHPSVIIECIKHVQKSGAAKIYVGDSSFVGKSTEGAIEKSGLRMIKSKRVKTIDFKKSEYVHVGIPNALRYRRLGLPKEIMQSQIIINIPVMKTHDCLPVTLGLKNMKGVLSDKDKRRFHSWGLEEGIIDVNRIVLPDLTIIDGLIGMEGDGPLYGTPANAKLLIASFDPLAAEVAAINAMGFDHEAMAYIQMAYEAGFGEKHLSKIDMVGDDLDSVKRMFKSSYYDGKTFHDGKIRVYDTRACSACRSVLNGYVREAAGALKEKDIGLTFLAGDLSGNGNQMDGATIGIGKCLYEHKQECTCYVPGCPPKKRNIKAAVEQLIDDK